MIKRYRFEIEGTGGDGQTWKTSGTVESEFHGAFDAANRVSFDQLTQGKAVYGRPGVGCRGPYDITKVTIEQVKQ